MKNQRSWSVAVFALKFFVLVIILGVLWWKVLPFYGQVLLQVTGLPLKYALGVPIDSGFVETEGVLNTESRLVFSVQGHERRMKIAHLVTNIPPYIALVLATAGLTWRRRGLILLYGCGIICFFHVFFIIMAMRFQDKLMQISEVPTAMVQFFLTLPFMLWIVFAYWDKLVTLFQDKNAEAEPCASGDVDKD
ncbi:MAG: hypothetical protein GX130_12690 [Candidatus Hydrogenedens sp.]|jgi:hypothetical protein|nr:hypothetical protein [Candidatus Hydrogenedens sp.]